MRGGALAWRAVLTTGTPSLPARAAVTTAGSLPSRPRGNRKRTPSQAALAATASGAAGAGTGLIAVSGIFPDSPMNKRHSTRTTSVSSVSGAGAAASGAGAAGSADAAAAEDSVATEDVFLTKSSRMSSKREAEVLSRIAELKKEGLWSSQVRPPSLAPACLRSAHQA